MNDSSSSYLFWHSRRGLLELDLLFVPFFTDCYDTLNASMQKQYQALLTHEDPELLAWCVYEQTPPDGLIDIIKAIQVHANPIQ